MHSFGVIDWVPYKSTEICKNLVRIEVLFFTLVLMLEGRPSSGRLELRKIIGLSRLPQANLSSKRWQGRALLTYLLSDPPPKASARISFGNTRKRRSRCVKNIWTIGKLRPRLRGLEDLLMPSSVLLLRMLHHLMERIGTPFSTDCLGRGRRELVLTLT